MALACWQEWPLFKQHELYQEYLKEKEDRRKQAVLNSQSSSIGPTTDMAFVEVLSSPIHCASFKKFVETEFCVEPLMFWCVTFPAHPLAANPTD